MLRTVAAVVFASLPAPAIAQDAKPPEAKPADAKPAEDPVPEWLVDFELAKSRARNTKLDLLLAFVGPDPFGVDARIDAAMFAKPDFAKEASKHFVLARFDYPQDQTLIPEGLRRQRAQLLARYRSDRLPVVWLADAQGVAYAKIRWAPATTEALLALIAERRAVQAKSAEALRRAATSRGTERVKALGEGLSCLDDEVVATAHTKEMLEILAADANGALGLKEPFDAIARDAAAKPFFTRLQDELQPLVAEKKWADLDVRIDAARKKHTGERWAEQYLTFLQGVRSAESDGGPVAALNLFELALARAPRSELAPEIDRRKQEAAAAVAKLHAEEERKKAEEAKKGKPKKK